MDLIYTSMILLYGLFLSGVVFLAGAYTTKAFVTRPSGSDACLLAGEKRCLGETAAKSIFIIAFLTVLVNILHFILHCAIMTETPLSDVFSILPAFITKTKYGKFTIFRTLFLVAIIVISVLMIKKEQKWLVISGIVFSCLLLIVIAMSGHQGAKGYMNIPFFLDALHLIAVSVWIGGLFFILHFLSFFQKNAKIDYWHNFISLINKYSDFATFCVIITLLTGVALTYFNIKHISILVDTRYGIILSVKMVLVGVTMIIGGINKFFVIRDINIIHAEKKYKDSNHKGKLLNLVTIEVAIGYIVLMLTSLLTHLSPEE